MLNLQLRSEFQGKRLKGTTVDFTNQAKTGALDVTAAEFLEITYPSVDLVKLISAVQPGSSRPIVVMGGRGQGKSHLLAALYHVLTDAPAAKSWLDRWASELSDSDMSAIQLRSDMFVIAEPLHLQKYKYLWDLLFERHPEGKYIKGAWEGLGDKRTDVPGYDLMLKMFQAKPTVLILDEFQTWFEALTNTKQYPWRNWAFNFIQILSEIAQNNPELLVLAVSVRDGDSDAYQQVRRVNPVHIDFQGPLAKRDRQRLILHRMFQNRTNIAPDQVAGLISVHFDAYTRLLDIPQSEHEQHRSRFIEAWPFSPQLLQLLDDQVLIATDAQETRDLIRILVDVFKGRGDAVPVITAADFTISEDKSGVAALLDSVSNQVHKNLRQKALRNLESLNEAVASKDVPHATEVLSALWLRSLAIDTHAGAIPAQLQVDVTRGKAVDDNEFQAELSNITENSFNIHPVGDKLVFRLEENSDAKLRAQAKNDKLFREGQDIDYLAKQIRYVFGGAENVSQAYRVIVLQKNWDTDPWAELDEGERPDRWDSRIPVVVLPEYPDDTNKALGKWLAKHIQKKRNIIRFLLPQKDSGNVYFNRDLIVLARAAYLADEWKKADSDFVSLHKKYQGEVQSNLRSRFDHFAILYKWNFSDASRCDFEIMPLNARGDKIPPEIQETIKKNLFIPEDFEDMVLEFAKNGDSVGKLITELQEPRTGEKPCIPWLGEVEVKEKTVRMCAAGKIAIDLRGMEMLQARPGEDEESAWQRIKGKLGTGRHLDETKILMPGVAASSGSIAASGTTAVTTETPGESTEVIPGGDQAATPIIDIFGGDTGGAGTPAPSYQVVSSEATSALNLIGKVEGWGIGPATGVRRMRIEVEQMTGAQLQELLKKLPDGITYKLEMEKEAN